MKVYTPSISSRTTDELIAIAHGTTKNWQQDAIDQAKQELKKRNISKEYQEIILKKRKETDSHLEMAYQQQLVKNKTIGYSIGEMVHIFLVAPFILIRNWRVDQSLLTLKQHNYQIKFIQRLLLLLGGTTFWAILLVISVNISQSKTEKERQAAIDNADISAWEKEQAGDDSISTDNVKTPLNNK